jgi:hypothetical protein
MLKRIELDNSIQLFRILLTNLDIRDYYADLTGDTQSGCHPNNNTTRGRVPYCYQFLLDIFLDKDGIVATHLK